MVDDPELDYLDLADAVLRGEIVVDDGEPAGLREGYTIGLGTFEGMVGDLLAQLATDVGSVNRALVLLSVPTSGLIHAWKRGATIGASASAMWMVRELRHRSERILITPSVCARRGDDYLDLAEAAERLAVAGDGALDLARLELRYTIERAPWLRMVGDLLGQVVGDAGSVEHAATVLGVPVDSLTEWVRWLVSRGSVAAACSRWPLAPGDESGLSAYLDLIEAVERGAVDGDNATDRPRLRDVYMVQLDSWERMEADLLGQIVADAGSVRKASKVLDVPRSTLGAWVRRHAERSKGARSRVEELITGLAVALMRTE